MIRILICLTLLFLLTDRSAGQSHWAYIVPERSELPAGGIVEWARLPIDRFVLSRLTERGLSPSAPADRATLLRRVSFDLTGLPPTPEELAIFLSDAAPDAYERQVDRLMASPRYGEHMAVAWLDLARYADTHGYHSDSQRDMWRWRDWVVDALNADKPYDEFSIEQLAGDLLDDATLEQRLATGFHRNHMLNNENGAIPEEYQVEYVIDRVNTTGTVWLGHTVACARCHDHKHDPLTQRDFYRLYAFFNNVPENGLGGKYGNSPPTMLAPTPPQRRELKRLAEHQSRLQRWLSARAAAAGTDQAAWEATVTRQESGLQSPPADAALHLKLNEAESGVTIKGTANWVRGKFGGALLCDGDTYIEAAGLPQWDRSSSLTLAAWVFPTTGDAMSLISRRDEQQYDRGFDFGVKNDRLSFRLTHIGGTIELDVRSRLPLKQRRWQQVTVTYDGSSRAAGAAIYLDGKPLELEVLRDDLTAHISTSGPLKIGGGAEDTNFRGMLDEIKVYSRTLSASEVDLLAGGNPIAEILRLPAERRTREQAAAVTRYFLENSDSAYRQRHAELLLVQQRQAELERQAPTVMVMQELPQARATHILQRGLYNEPGQEVAAGTPAFLPPMLPQQPTNRLGLALWLMSPRHPLTARVAVNRQWQAIFGRGLVRTADDFGTHGEPPSHPKLLDFLAREFCDSGWSVKRLQRQIVTSATYRQSSTVAAEKRAADPENRLLSRGPRERLPAEAIRDGALYAAGILNLELGGPGVRPYQPGELWKDLAYDTQQYTAQVFLQSEGADLYRRSLYTFWKRSVPPPNMALFDAPNRETCTVTRSRTSSPLQSLVLLNDTTFVEAARAIAARALRESPEQTGDRGPLQRIFVHVLSRQADAQECETLLKLLADERAHYGADRAAAEKLSGVGELPVDASIPPDELAAWTSVAGVLLNLHEAVTKR